MKRLLVVAGEGSGDALAAPVVARLGAESFGLGGRNLAEAGTELVADLRNVAAMGFGGPFRRAPAIVAAALRIVRQALARRPAAALLVGFSELNAKLAPFLRARGIRVVWYAPPQVWAWRAARARQLGAACDRLALLLPFERAVWRTAGANADYVGHPALDRPFAPAASEPDARTPLQLALLPGSRAHEVRAHLSAMLGSVRCLEGQGARILARVVRANALDRRTAAFVEKTARAAGVGVTDEPLALALAGHHAAVVASGTATLECAALGVPPVIVYRTDAVTYALARRLVRVRHIGLPNLVLGRAAFPELLQETVTPRHIASAVTDVLSARSRHVAACESARAVLGTELDGRLPHQRVAAMLEPWLQ